MTSLQIGRHQKLIHDGKSIYLKYDKIEQSSQVCEKSDITRIELKHIKGKGRSVIQICFYLHQQVRFSDRELSESNHQLSIFRLCF